MQDEFLAGEALHFPRSIDALRNLCADQELANADDYDTWLRLYAEETGITLPPSAVLTAHRALCTNHLGPERPHRNG